MKNVATILGTGISTLAVVVILVGPGKAGLAAPPATPAELTYSGDSKSLVPLVGTQEVQTVVAEKWLLVTEEPESPEGLIFDRNGNLYLVVVGNGSDELIDLVPKESQDQWREKRRDVSRELRRQFRVHRVFPQDLQQPQVCWIAR